jgi:hypothetical protein
MSPETICYISRPMARYASRNLRAVAFALAMAGLALRVDAADFSLLVGGTRTDAPSARTFGFNATYAHDLSPHLFGSLTYQNEGHVPGHHRDGHAVQLWTRLAGPGGVTLAAGAGPYHYFDTAVAEGEGGFEDAHGWGVIYSLAAIWRMPSSRLTWQLRVNHVETRNNLDTTMVVAGIGYALDQDASFAGATSSHAPRAGEVTVLAGQTIVNSFESQNALARGVEVRYAFGPVLRGSVAWLNEGDARLLRRDGLVAQLWLEPSFSGDRFTLGIGFGPYLAVDRYQEGGRRTLGLLGTTASYRIGAEFVARLSFLRSVSRNDRDSDIILLGLGWRF